MSRLVARALSATVAAAAVLAFVPTVQAAAPCSGDVDSASLRSCIDAATAAYVGAWTPTLATRGIAATAPAVVVFRATPVNPCVDGSEGDVAVASFWCARNGTVYVSRLAAPWWTRQYAREARRAGVLADDARRVHRSQRRLLRGYALQGAATEYAHELGHWVQQQAGVQAWYEQRILDRNFRRAGRYQSAFELAADCMAGWVQARAAVTGGWPQTPVVRWAQHATIAELGGITDGLRPGFSFPPEDSLIAHGGPHTRLLFYDAGRALAAAGADGLARCTARAARYTNTKLPPPLR